MSGAAADLERRLAKLEAIEQIRALKARYARVCDEGYDGAALAALFTEDGYWEGNTFGRIEGREAIRRSAEELGGETFRWATHLFVSPVVSVEDDLEHARGDWLLVQLATVPHADGSGRDEAVVAVGRYADRLRRDGDGRWLFTAVEARFDHVSAWQAGWAEEPFRTRLG